MESRKFDPARAEKLNDPRRLEMLPPDILWHAVGAGSPSTVVDIGAGTGLLTAAFARLAPDAHFYAADISPDMLAFMRAHLPADVAGRVTPVLSTETSVPLPDDVAGVVTTVALYHELDDPPALLREVHRLLAPEGRLLIVDWKKGAAAADHGPSDSHRVSGEQIAAALREAGFTGVETHEVLEHFSVVTGTRK